MSSYEGIAGYGTNSGGALIVPAALQPNLYGAVGMWALQWDGGAPGVISGADRSGNPGVNDLVSVNPYTAKDLIPGKAVGWIDNSNINGMPQGAGFNTGAQYKRVDFTITCKVQLPKIGVEAAYTIMSGASIATNVEFAFTWHTAVGLSSFWQHGASVGVGYSSTLFPNDAKWHFVSYRRRLSGGGPNYEVTIGMDKTYQTSGALTPPDTTGATPTIAVGQQAGAVNVGRGVVCDVCFWPSYLTDVQVNGLEDIAMGNAAFRALAAS